MTTLLALYRRPDAGDEALAALDAGLASDEMRVAGRNLREIAPGLATMLVLEEASEFVPDGWR